MTTIVALCGPIATQYALLERNSHFRRPFSPRLAATALDFFAINPANYILGHIPVVTDLWIHRGIERRLFPGIVISIFAVAGITALARRRRNGGHVRDTELRLVGIAGLCGAVLALGDRSHVGGVSIAMPFALVRHLPGFSGIRAVARLALVAELALALFAAVGIENAGRRLRYRTALIGGVALVVVVVAESAMPINLVHLPTNRDDGGVADALRALPRGVVLELPIRSSTAGIAWPYVEAPRQLVAIHDGDPRVNGYSGFQPAGFDHLTAVLDTFPRPAAIAEVRALDVRYIVLRTRLIGPLTPTKRRLDRDGNERYYDSTARSILDAVPWELIETIEQLPGGYLVQLRT